MNERIGSHTLLYNTTLKNTYIIESLFYVIVRIGATPQYTIHVHIVMELICAIKSSITITIREEMDQCHLWYNRRYRYYATHALVICNHRK